MKLQDYRETFYEYSGKASDFTRQLAFAGIAVIWLFKKDTTSSLSIPHELLLPGLLIVSGLALDMLQYCVASLIWRLYYRSKERQGVAEDQELGLHSEWLERPIWALFCAKILLVLAAYALIARYFVTVLLLR